MKRFSLIFALVLAVLPEFAFAGQRINRREVVSRHNVTTHATLPKSPAQVGNGHFAFNFDITGAQTFVPFNTLSDWGWHSSPLPPGVELDDYRPVPYESHGRTILYRNSNPDAPEITKYLTRNPHRMNLGRIGLVLLKDDGTAACEADLDTATQHIDLWSGRVESRFSLGGAESEVVTLCHPTEDIVALKIRSQLITSGRLKAFIEFPYPDEENMKDYVGLYDVPSKHLSNLNP
ncbi:MAG: hypothetical protein HUJ91_04745, partial [Bacteroidales bacterium]|nr:hypothetical protein [Bacteroidales bacterium]